MKWTPWKLFWEMVSKVGFRGAVTLDTIFYTELPVGDLTLNKIVKRSENKIPYGDLTLVDIFELDPKLPSGVETDLRPPAQTFSGLGEDGITITVSRKEMIEFLEKLNVDLTAKANEPAPSISIARADVAKMLSSVKAIPIEEYEEALDEVGFVGGKSTAIFQRTISHLKDESDALFDALEGTK